MIFMRRGIYQSSVVEAFLYYHFDIIILRYVLRVVHILKRKGKHTGCRIPPECTETALKVSGYVVCGNPRLNGI